VEVRIRILSITTTTHWHSRAQATVASVAAAAIAPFAGRQVAAAVAVACCASVDWATQRRRWAWPQHSWVRVHAPDTWAVDVESPDSVWFPSTDDDALNVVVVAARILCYVLY